MKTAVFHRIGEPKRETFTNSIDQIKAFRGAITFDGIYDSVWEYRETIRDLTRERRVWLFFAGDTLGAEGFINKQQLLTLADEYGCLIGWHTWSHPDLTKLSDDDIRRELDAPSWVPRTVVAYPHGEFDARVIGLVREAGYQKAYSTIQGNNDDYSMHREYL